MQRIIWTVLPKSAEIVNVSIDDPTDDLIDPVSTDMIRLRFSALVSPRIADSSGSGSGSLSEFDSFLDWPSRVGVLAFALGIEGVGSFQALLDPVAPYPPRSDVWTGIFGPNTPVTPHSFDDHATAQILSYPEAEIQALLTGVYAGTVGAAPTVPPTAGQWTDPTSGLPAAVSDLRFLDRDRAGVLANLSGLLAEQGHIPGSSVDTAVKKAAVLEQFLGGPTDIGQSSPAQDLRPTPTFDFHQGLAVVSQYPKLQRLLGTVLDLYVDVPLDAAGDRTVWLEADVDPSELAMRPGTRARIERNAFRAIPADPALIDRGLLQAGGARFAPITLDLDGALLKLASTAAMVPNTDPASAQPLAALRSGGISLAMADRAGVVAATLKRAKQNNDALEAGQPVVLYAEDLIRGFRPDIWEEEAGRWSSLTAQEGTLAVASTFGSGVGGLPPLTEEAVVTTSPTSEDPSGVQFKLPESIFGWTGWSLAATQPGSVLDNPQADGSGVVVTDPTSGPQPDLDVVVSVKPKPASLPLLRFGADYRVRVRTVDLAGNGPTLDVASGPSDETTTFRYGRFEPVPAPEVLLVAPRTEGETVDRIVIRSIDAADTNPSVSIRHIAPPIASWALVETHGKFDRAAGGRRGPDPAAYNAYKQREKGGFGSRTGANGSTVSHPQAEADPSSPGTFYYDQVPLDINYLPDPLALGACLRGLPGFTTPEWRPFLEGSATWPALAAFRLQVQETAPIAPPFDGVNRILTVALGRAEVAEVFLSSFFADGVEDRMGVFNLLPDSLKTALRADARLGFLWALTPDRKLTLLHAVRVPLKAPGVYQVGVTELIRSVRKPGETFATIEAMLSLDTKSTGKVDVSAGWIDCLDDASITIPGTGVLVESDFEVQQEITPAFSVDADRELTQPFVADFLELGDRHEFGDTKHRVVDYHFEAVTRFAEYFVEHVVVTTVGLGAGSVATEQPVPLAKPVVAGSVRVRTADRSLAFTEGAGFTVAGNEVTLEVGALPGYVPASTEVVISYLPAPASNASPAPASLSIPSSARPAPPEVDFVLPTFRWFINGTTRRRQGGGLRVYLRRPWFSSGCGEKLGVVLWNDPLPARAVFPDAPLHVTHWALDPLYAGPSLPSDWPSLDLVPSRQAEPAAVGLTLPEFTGGQVDVAVHEVAFDTERKLWFADLEFDAGAAYNPFIRLALARYQKHSIPDLELSQVVRVDYQQLAPDRAMAITRQGDKLRVVVAGPDGSTVAGPGVAEAWIERKDPAVAAQELGWERRGGVIPLVRSTIGDSTIWEGLVKAPTALGRHRIVVQQSEQFPNDSAALVVVPDKRIIYTDTVEYVPTEIP